MNTAAKILFKVKNEISRKKFLSLLTISGKSSLYIKGLIGLSISNISNKDTVKAQEQS